MNEVVLSIVLCTYNPRHEYLLRVMDSIVAQLSEVPNVEFIVVDNNSSPPLQDRNLLAGYPCRILREPIQGLTAARVAAIRAASGSIILFVDDDNILHPGFLKGITCAFEDPNLGLLGGAIEPEYEVTPPSWLRKFEHQLAIRRYESDVVVETTGLPYSDYFPVGAGFSVRRELALAHIDEAQKSGGLIEGRKGAVLSAGEDLDLAFFCLHKGYKLRVQGSLRLTHLIPAARLSEDYTIRIAVSSLESCRELHEKWSKLLGEPIFAIYSMSALSLWIRIAAHAMAGVMSPASRIRSKILQEFLRNQRKAGEKLARAKN